jgi:hypothetical protein
MYIEKNNIVKEEIKKVGSSVLFLDYIYRLEHNHYFLTSQHISTHSNGCKYYVYNRGDIIASFYSYHNINYYDFSKEDKERLTFLFMLLRFLDME